MPFAHSSRFLCPLSSFLSVPRIFFPALSPPSPSLPSTRHCFRNYDTNSSPPHSVCSVETQSACRWISNERAPTRILLASVFSIRSSLLLLRTINAPLKSYLSLSLFFFLGDIYKVSRGIFFPFFPRYQVTGSIRVYCMNYSWNICIRGGGKVYGGILYPGVARVEDRKKKRKAIERDDLSVNGEWKSECPIREGHDPGSYSVGIIASASIRHL